MYLSGGGTLCLLDFKFFYAISNSYSFLPSCSYIPLPEFQVLFQIRNQTVCGEFLVIYQIAINKTIIPTSITGILNPDLSCSGDSEKTTSLRSPRPTRPPGGPSGGVKMDSLFVPRDVSKSRSLSPAPNRSRPPQLPTG